MKKKTLSGLLQAVQEPVATEQVPKAPPVPAEPVESHQETPSETPTDRPAKSATPTRVATPKAKPTTLTDRPAAPTAAGPPHTWFERKESRVRPDQNDALNGLTKRLNRARGRTGERLTDNTLIRVGIDLLLSRADDLRGTTEEELRASLGLSS